MNLWYKRSRGRPTDDPKRQISISISIELLKNLDKVRGDQPRSQIISGLLEEWLVDFGYELKEREPVKLPEDDSIKEPDEVEDFAITELKVFEQYLADGMIGKDNPELKRLRDQISGRDPTLAELEAKRLAREKRRIQPGSAEESVDTDPARS